MVSRTAVVHSARVQVDATHIPQMRLTRLYALQHRQLIFRIEKNALGGTFGSRSGFNQTMDRKKLGILSLAIFTDQHPSGLDPVVLLL